MTTITRRAPGRMTAHLVGAAFAVVGMLAVPAVAASATDGSSTVRSANEPATAFARTIKVKFQPERIRYEKAGGESISGHIGTR